MKKLIIIVLSFILLLGMSYFIFFNHSESKEIPDTKKIEINNVDEENQISESLDKNDDKEPEVIMENKEDINKSDNKKKEESIKSSDNKKENTVDNVPKVENKKEQAVKEGKQEEVKKVTELVSIGLQKEQDSTDLEELNSKIESLSKKVYIILELLKQIYSDMDFNNLSDPKKSYALNKFLDRLKGIKFDD